MSNSIPDDLTELVQLDEESLLQALHKRYIQHNIYTRTGDVLIAVNPYQTLDMYTVPVRNPTEPLPSIPHVYTVAERCLRQLLETRLTQSVLVSGESGSGKTQTTKYVMRYLSETCKSDSGERGIERVFLKANPILESLGNAKTRRNANSSRFGKYVTIHFHSPSSWSHTLQLVGATTETYLLEKTRFIQQHVQEQNFHIIYQLGLAQGGTESSLVETQMALGSMGFTEQGIGGLLNTVRALFTLLHESCLSPPSPSLERATNLLGLETSALLDTLLIQTITVGQETFRKPRPDGETISLRHTLIKTLYAALFQWVVANINTTMKSNIDEKEQLLSIGLLDIFGFEVFDTNGFEQLCINFANEQLQVLFNDQMIQSQQREYREEGITWSDVDFYGNDICLEELTSHVFPLLDDAARHTNHPDQTYARTLLAKAPFQSIQFPKQDPPPNFGISHFAGTVTYQMEGLSHSNIDRVHPNLIALLKTSRHTHIQEMIQYIPDTSVSSLAFQSVSNQFRRSLRTLLTMLSDHSIHYIRCLKPNDEDRPHEFCSERVLEQLRYSGVLEAVRVSRAGYPVRMLHKDYICRYQALSPKTVDGLAKGTTKYFLKHEAYRSQESRLWKCQIDAVTKIQSHRRKQVQIRLYHRWKRATIRIQSQVRRKAALTRLIQEITARYLQSYWRGQMARYMGRIRHKAIHCIQGVARRYLSRRNRAGNFLARRIATWIYKHRYKRRLQVSHEASRILTRYWRRLLAQGKLAQLQRIREEERIQDQKRAREREWIQEENRRKERQLMREEETRSRYLSRMEAIRRKYKREVETARRNQTELQTEVERMEETVRRNHSNKLEILGQMENLMEENQEIRGELEKYRAYIRSRESEAKPRESCLLQ